MHTSLLNESELRSLRPSPIYAELAASGARLSLIGSIEVNLETGDRTYPTIFLVSPDLSGEVVLGLHLAPEI